MPVFRSILSLLVGAASLVVLTGWFFELLPLVRPFENQSPVQFNSALLFLFLSSALLLKSRTKNSQQLFPLYAVVAAFSLLTLLQDIYAKDFGIDTLFLSPFYLSDPDRPGRMSPNASLCLFMLAVSMLFSASRRYYLVAPILSILVFSIAISALISHIADLQPQFGWSAFTRMSSGTALLHLALSLATLLDFSELHIHFKNRIRVWMIFSIGLLGILASNTVWAGTREAEKKALAAEFEQYAQSRLSVIQHSIDTNIQLLNRVGGFFEGSDNVTEAEFKTFVQPLLRDNPSLLAVDWAPRVEGQAAREKLETQLRGTHQQNFNFTELETEISTKPRALAPIYFPVLYTHSLLPGTEKALGFDHASDSRRLASMADAIRALRPKSSPALRLFRLPDISLARSDVLIFVPVSPQGDNIAHVQGFIVGVIRLPKLIEHTFSLLPPLGLDMEIAEFTQNGVEDLRFRFLAPRKDPPVPTAWEDRNRADSDKKQLSSEHTLRVADSRWLIRFSPTEQYLREHQSSLPLVMLMFGLTITALVTLYFLFLFRKQDSTESLMLARTKQVDTLTVEQTRLTLAAEAKSLFLANMSHEIRTPLTAILGFTEALVDSELPRSEQLRILQIIQRNGSHLLELINDILDISKIDADALTIEAREFSPASVVEDVRAMFATRANEKNLRLLVNFKWPIPSRIKSDSLRFKQVLVNLVGNAIKFTERGDVDLTINYDVTRNALVCSVRDSGIGIAPEKLNSLFDPFTQADISTTRKYGGTGLGLSIAKRLTERLGGRISVESKLGEGSTFTFSIDCGSPENRELAFELTETSKEILPKQNATNKLYQGRVLVADDAIDNRNLIQFLLKDSGLDLTFVENGQEALSEVTERQFDLVLLDLQMPVMDGYTAVRLMRERGLAIPIVAVSGNAMQHDIERALEAGCTAHLGKPFRKMDLLKLFETYLTVSEASKAVISARLEEDETIASLVLDFIENLSLRIADLHNALAEGDFEQVQYFAHKLKGSAGLYGFDELSHLAADLERAAIQQLSEKFPKILGEIDKNYKLIQNGKQETKRIVDSLSVNLLDA